ncbi:FecR family protein [Pikeienuella sp. HZG-20]|uniref:FecR family protein n=1 Tax=Paludibacillus litoralis TaxID=3133267 RepID=UPI0030EC9C59
MSSRSLALIMLGAVMTAAPVGALERAGQVSTVQQQAFQASGQVGFTVEKGADIFQQARVYTKQYGSIEIRLEDGTNLTVAPNASLVIDEYVFAGDAKPGVIALSLARGAIRMISGRMPEDGVSIKTSVATIGVRGTTFWVNAISDEETQLWVTEGAVTATATQSGERFEFAAPSHVTCSAVSCVAGGTPPVPATFPLGDAGGGGDGPGDDGGGESGNDR